MSVECGAKWVGPLGVQPLLLFWKFFYICIYNGIHKAHRHEGLMPDYVLSSPMKVASGLLFLLRNSDDRVLCGAA